MRSKEDIFFQTLIEIAPKAIWSVDGDSYTDFAPVEKVRELESELEKGVKDFRSYLMDKNPEDRITIIEYTIRELLIPYGTSRLAMKQFPDSERDEGRATMLLLWRAIFAILRIAEVDLKLTFTDDFVEYWERREINKLLGEINKKSNRGKTQDTNGPAKPTFSTIEWATIFYYTVGRKLPENSREVSASISEFIKKHGIERSANSLKNKYYEAKKRINDPDKADYPIERLEKIIPFIRKNYPDSITTLKNDIFYLKDESKDY